MRNLFFLISTCFWGFTVFAQTYTDGELIKFIYALESVNEIYDDTQEKIKLEIEKSGLSFERYNILAQSLQDASGTVDASDQEFDNFQQTSIEVLTIQATAERESIKMIKAHGLEIARYEEILVALKTDKALLEKVQAML